MMNYLEPSTIESTAELIADPVEVIPEAIPLPMSETIFEFPLPDDVDPLWELVTDAVLPVEAPLLSMLPSPLHAVSMVTINPSVIAERKIFFIISSILKNFIVDGWRVPALPGPGLYKPYYYCCGYEPYSDQNQTAEGY